MSNADVITEKVYCHDTPSTTNDAATMASLLNNGSNNMWNNPFCYLIWMMFANRLWNNDGNAQSTQNAEIMAKLNSLSSQAANNQNTNLMMDAINGNHEALHSIANTLGVSFAQVQGAFGTIQSAITQVGGQVGMSSQQVINSVLLGNKDLVQQISSCCCENKRLVQQMGYEGQLRDQANTANLMSRIDQLANGVQQGFASVGYAAQTNTNAIIQSGNANTQRILDTLNGHWSLEQSQALQDAKFEISQLKQNQYLVSQLGSKCD